MNASLRTLSARVPLRPGSLACLAALLGLSGQPAASLAGAGDPPGNVLLVLADDLGVEVLSAYGLDTDQPATPTIDFLASQGVRFNHAWAYPLCTPARATIQTGRHPLRTGIGELLGGLIDTDLGPFGLPLDEVTIPEMLSLGAPDTWETACIGKWHLSSVDTGGYLGPNVAGYDHFAGTLGNFNAGETYTDWERVVNGVICQETSYATTVQVDETLEWIGGASEPWFCMLNFNAPHLPFHAPPADLHSQDLSSAGDPAEDSRPYYKAMVEAMDTELSRLLAGLGSSRENTTIIFMSDNGTPAAAAAGKVTEATAKGSFFEGGIRVPLIVTGPLVGAPGGACDALVDVTDILATVADVAGVDPNSVLAEGETVDGVSLLPYLNDPSLASFKTHVFSELFRQNGPTGGLEVFTGSGPMCQVDLGFGGPGGAVLTVCGDPLAPDKLADVHLSGAAPSSPAWLAISLNENPVPAYGGWFVPYPNPKVAALITDANGEMHLPGISSSKGPFSLTMQVGIMDPSQPFGMAISNAVRLEFLPPNTKAVRDERFKLVRVLNGGDDFFYDLQLDPLEQVELLSAGSMSPEQQAGYASLGAEIDAFLLSF